MVPMKKLKGSLFIHVIAINLIIFTFFSIIITYLSTRLPDKLCFYKKWLYKERKWERGGRFYQDIFKVKKWKNCMPELGDFIKAIYPKKYIKNHDRETLLIYLTESCKAELTHFAIIASTFTFHLWSDFTTATIIFIIAFFLNMPYIIIQRYNRPRIIGILEYKDLKLKTN